MIEKIEKTILNDAEKQKKEILDKAEKERSEKIGSAKEDIKRERERLAAKGKQEAARERNRLISEANLNAKRELLRAKEDLIDSVIAKAQERLEKHTKDKSYKATLEKLEGECEKELGKHAKIYVRGKDKKLLHGSHERDIGPGVIGESEDGGLYLDNTFEMRLEREKDNIRKEIGGVLFK